MKEFQAEILQLKNITIVEYLKQRQTEITAHITEHRRAMNISEETLAKWINTSRGRIRRIEAGETGYTQEEVEILQYMLNMPSSDLKLSYNQYIRQQAALTNSTGHRILGDILPLEFPAEIRNNDLQIPKLHRQYRWIKIKFSPNDHYVMAAFEMVNVDITEMPLNHPPLISLPFKETIICTWDTSTGMLIHQHHYDHPIVDYLPLNDTYLITTESCSIIEVELNKQASQLQIIEPSEEPYATKEWWRFIEDSDDRHRSLQLGPTSSLLLAADHTTGILTVYERNTANKWQLIKTLYLGNIEYRKSGTLEDESFKDLSYKNMKIDPITSDLYIFESDHHYLVNWTHTPAEFKFRPAVDNQALSDIGFIPHPTEIKELGIIVGQNGLLEIHETRIEYDEPRRDTNHLITIPRNRSAREVHPLGIDLLLCLGTLGHPHADYTEHITIWNEITSIGEIILGASRHGLAVHVSLSNNREKCAYWNMDDHISESQHPIIQTINLQNLTRPNNTLNDMVRTKNLANYPTFGSQTQNRGRPINPKSYQTLIEEISENPPEDSSYDDTTPKFSANDMLSWHWGDEILSDILTLTLLQDEPDLSTIQKRLQYMKDNPHNRANAEGDVLYHSHLLLSQEYPTALLLIKAIQKAGFSAKLLDLSKASQIPAQKRELGELILSRSANQGEPTDELFSEGLQQFDFILIHNLHLLNPDVIYELIRANRLNETTFWLITETVNDSLQFIENMDKANPYMYQWTVGRIIDISPDNLFRDR